MFNLKKSIVILPLALMSFGLSTPAVSSDLRGELNSLFNGMTNYTQPGVFESTRRGVIAGGGFSARSRTMNIQLAAFEPPSIKAGCGGIDIFMGSFSHINKDQFITFLRAVASNAAGYAFQMALQAGCPICITVMNKMEAIARDINSLNMNSCQLARGLVTGDREAIQGKIDFKQIVENVKSGWSNDVADGKTNANSASQVQQQNDPDGYAKKYLGNIVWQAMIDKNVNTWYGLLPDDTSLMEVLMSISGTVINEKPKTGKDGEILPVKVYPGGLVTLQDLVEGSKRTTGNGTQDQTMIYQCDTKNECMNPIRTKPLNIDGLAILIEQALNKPDGIVFKLAHGSDPNLSWTAQEKALLSNFPVGVGAALHHLALGSQDAAKSLGKPASKIIALEMSYSLMQEFLSSIEASLSGLDENRLGEVKHLVGEARQRLSDEASLLTQRYGSAHTILKDAQTLMAFMRYDHPILSKSPTAKHNGSGATE